jgi:hypothetical protein
MIQQASLVLVVAAVTFSGAWFYFGGQEKKAVTDTANQVVSDSRDSNAEQAEFTDLVPKETNEAMTDNEPSEGMYGADEMSFTTPVGYKADEEWFGKANAELGDWRKVSGIDRYIIVAKQDVWERSYAKPAVDGRGAPAHITIALYQNETGATVTEWLQKKEYTPEKTPVSYSVGGKTGLRFSVSPEMFRSDIVVVPHKKWIVVFYNMYDDAAYPERPSFEKLLNSVVFSN